MVECFSEVRCFSSSLCQELSSVFDLTREDCFVDQQNTWSIARILIHQIVVQDSSSKSRVLQCFIEENLFGFCFWNHALGCVCDSTCVVLRCDCGGEDILVRIHWFSKDFIPLSESNHNVPWHGYVGFKEDCAHWDNSSEHELNSRVFISSRKCVYCLSCVFECSFILSFEHSTPDNEVMVVHSIEFVKLRVISSEFDVSIVSFNCSDVAFNRFFPLSNPSIDVRRHVDKVTHTWHDSSKNISSRQSSLWVRR